MNSHAKFNLTDGPIFNKLLKLSLPIMATSLMQSAHQLTNMFWLSWLGEGYVAAAGLSGQFLWLSLSFIMMCRMGAEIGVSQNIGRGDPETAKSYAQNGFMLAMAIGIVLAILTITLRVTLLGFFDIGNAYVAHIAQRYLAITALSIPFNFGHFVVTGIYGGYGNTKLPFYINTIALLLNIILTPIFMFVLNMGIIGAALGMVVSAAFNLIIKIWAMTRYKNRPFKEYTLLVKVSWDKIKQILKWGVPVGTEALLFTLFFMIVTRLITSFGGGAVAAHQVGLQIESLSFMIAGGFGSALTAFVGQNYGAQKWGRLRSAFKASFIFMGIYGVIISSFLFILATPLVSIFLYDPESIAISVSYLRIVALTQFLTCIEGVASGGFRGRGLTLNPSIASISSNILRVIMCYTLAATALGITGIWVGMALAVTIRSVWLLTWHFINIRKLPKTDEIKPSVTEVS